MQHPTRRLLRIIVAAVGLLLLLVGLVLVLGGLISGTGLLAGVLLVVAGLTTVLATLAARRVASRIPALGRVPGGVGAVLGVVALLAFIGALVAVPTPAPGARPTATAAAQALVVATPPTMTPVPVAMAAPSAARVTVTGAGPTGVNLRADPTTSAARLKLIRDGAELDVVGEDRQVDGRVWRNVRDPADGATGWVAAEFVEAAAQVASAPPPC